MEPMPPPLEASQMFSFHRPTMPSRLSEASFRKQEIGRPRWVPPFDRTGVAGMNHSLACSRRCAGRGRGRRRSRRRRGEQVLEFLPASGSGRTGWLGRNRSAAVTGAIDMDLVATWHLHCVEHFGFPLTILGRVSACNARVVNQRGTPCLRAPQHTWVLLRRGHSVLYRRPTRAARRARRPDGLMCGAVGRGAMRLCGQESSAGGLIAARPGPPGRGRRRRRRGGHSPASIRASGRGRAPVMALSASCSAPKWDGVGGGLEVAEGLFLGG